MSTPAIVRIGSLKRVADFQQHVRALGITVLCDEQIVCGPASPLLQPWQNQGLRVGNRIAIHPMEGWDGTLDGNPSDATLRRWRRFGLSGAKLIWGGEAVAVEHAGRANPNQLLIAEHTRSGLERLRTELMEAHVQTTGSTNGLVIGLQLTHSGRFARPNRHDRAEPRIVYRHPLLDGRIGLPPDYPTITDAEIEQIAAKFHQAARLARELGFDFVDVKHCHGYLGHELLSAHTRPGRYGGCFENRTRFLREVVEGIRAAAPGLRIGVRLSAFDTVPYRRGPDQRGVPEATTKGATYRWGFGVAQDNPEEGDLDEAHRLLALLESLDVKLVNITVGSPYYNPHLQRPALFPPSDGYQPPRDPLFEVARHLAATRELKQKFPHLLMVGSGYSYLQDFLPHVGQAAVREGWTDFVGLGRMALAYPEFLWDATNGRPPQRARICRTFSDCTTAPRIGLPSGCYPLDDHYRKSDNAEVLRQTKLKIFGGANDG
jgi:2,4-dienoyl-CoA reductase-like NADH-dependent reductase (Old Yellow Enzyme family)